MPDSQFLDVGIGLVFILLLMSILTSSVNDFIISIRAQKGKELKDSISMALYDSSNQNWAELFYDAPVIDSMKRSEKRLPSYLSSEIFAKGLIETVAIPSVKDDYEIAGETITYAPVKYEKTLFERFQEGVKEMQGSDTKMMLQTLIDNSDNKMELLELNIRNWFDRYMERVTGWYRRKTRGYLFLIALFLTALLNIDSIRITSSLWTNTVLREAMANAASSYDLEKDPTIPTKNDSTFEQKLVHIKEGYKRLNLLGLPIGWSKNNVIIEKIDKKYANKCGFFNMIGYYAEWLWCHLGFSKIFGLLFTATAVCFGAPYWYDILNKLLSLKKNTSAPANPAK